MNISLSAEKLFTLAGLPVTNTLLMTWIIIAFVILVSALIRARLQLVPHGLQNAAELAVEKLLSFVESVVGSPAQARKFFPLIGTIFFAVLFSNLLEIVPGLGTVGLLEIREGKQLIIPFIRSASADLNFTLALAISAVLAVQIFGLASIGFFKYAGKFINFRGPVEFFVGLLELVSEVAKIVSFSFRLFGNIFAGEVLLTVVLFLVPYLVPLPFLFLEIFVGFVQALVFSMLTLVFLKMAVTEHH